MGVSNLCVSWDGRERKLISRSTEILDAIIVEINSYSVTIHLPIHYVTIHTTMLVGLEFVGINLKLFCFNVEVPI